MVGNLREGARGAVRARQWRPTTKGGLERQGPGSGVQAGWCTHQCGPCCTTRGQYKKGMARRLLPTQKVRCVTHIGPTPFIDIAEQSWKWRLAHSPIENRVWALVGGGSRARWLQGLCALRGSIWAGVGAERRQCNKSCPAPTHTMEGVRHAAPGAHVGQH
jgi:hypothetical protein